MTSIVGASNISPADITTLPALSCKPAAQKSSHLADHSLRGARSVLGTVAKVTAMLAAVTRGASAVGVETLDVGGDGYPAIKVTGDSCATDSDSCHYYTKVNDNRVRRSCSCDAYTEMNQPYARVLVGDSSVTALNLESQQDIAVLNYDGQHDILKFCVDLPANDTSDASLLCTDPTGFVGETGIITEDQFQFPVGVGAGMTTDHDSGSGNCDAKACTDSVVSVAVIEGALDAAGIDPSKVVDIKIGLIPAGESRIYHDGALLTPDEFCEYINNNFDNSTHLRPEGNESSSSYTFDNDAYSYCNPPPGPDVGFIVGMVFVGIAGCVVVGCAATYGVDKLDECKRERQLAQDTTATEATPRYNVSD